MPEADKFEVTKLPDQRETDKGLAFLERASRREINAKKEFDKLKPKRQQDLRNKFDHWLDGNVYNKYFHGFPGDPKHDQCFIFKWEQAGAMHRLYGFLTKPRPAPDAGFKVCILVCYGRKPGGGTHDPAKLGLAESLRLNPDVLEEVKKAFRQKQR